MKMRKLNKIIFASLFAALICLFNAVLHIPAPGGNGFLNIGDAFLINGVLFSGPYGIISAIIGGVLSDLILGYTVYIPATAVLKGIGALTVFLLCRNNKKIWVMIISALIGEAIITAGYFLYEYFAMGLTEGAILNIPFNIIQSVASLVFAAVLYKPFEKVFKAEKKSQEE